MKSRLLPILITGFVLALGLLLAIQVTDSLRGGKQPVQTAQVTFSPEDFNQTVDPAIFKTISERDGKLRVSGTSAANAAISIRNNGQNFRQVKANSEGEWNITLNTENDGAMIVDVVAFVENGAEVKSDETLIRVPAPKTIDVSTIDGSQRALIMVTAPGGPTRIVQSPFEAPSGQNPISIGPIEYDNSGSAIYSGTSGLAGQLRIFTDEELIGQRSVEANGRWFFIAIESLGEGSYQIRAELTTVEGLEYSASVPFQRLSHTDDPDVTTRSLRVNYEPEIWQVSRNIHGGGRQYTAIFAPVEIAADTEG